MAIIARARGLAERPASAHDQAALMQAIVEQQLARVRGDVPLGQDRSQHFVGEPSGSDLEAVRGDHGLAQARPQRVGVAVGGEEHALGGDCCPVSGR